MNDTTKRTKTIYLRELGWLSEDDRLRLAALPPELRDGSEVILAALNGATAGDQLALKKLGELVKRALPSRWSGNAERYAVFLTLLPREWESSHGLPIPMNQLLSAYDRRFRDLMRDQFEAAKAEEPSDVLFVGRISAAVGAFGDQEKSAAAERYESARREGDRHLAAYGRPPAALRRGVQRVDPRST